MSNNVNDILRAALNNLPSGRTALSNVKECQHWEPTKEGTFLVKQYRTIEQTETLAGKN